MLGEFASVARFRLKLTCHRKPETYDRPTEPQNVVVKDITGEESQYTLDSHGFQIYRHQSKEKDFVDDEKIKAEYYPEIDQLLKDAYVTPGDSHIRLGSRLTSIYSAVLVPSVHSSLTTPYVASRKTGPVQTLLYVDQSSVSISTSHTAPQRAV